LAELYWILWNSTGSLGSDFYVTIEFWNAAPTILELHLVEVLDLGGGGSGEGGRLRWCRFNSLVSAQEGRQQDKRCCKMKWMQWACLGSMGMKRDTAHRRDGVDRRRRDSEEGKGRTQHQVSWRESYRAEKWRKSTRSIQILEINGEDLKQW
jgi:hypothetical protein